jgi:predicted ATPase
MRIDKVIIDNFKNLKNFTIDFNEESVVTVIVGQNGVGKSNLLEALIIIFRDLDFGIAPSFKYEIFYVCREYKIHIDADPYRARSSVEININGKKVSYKEFLQEGREKYLPNYVFGYYSGFNDRMEKHFEKHQKRFYDDLINGVPKPLRPLLYARHDIHSNFVLLSFFYEQDQKVLEFLSKNLGIEGLDSVLFIMKKPPWKSKQGDPRFWNAKGVVEGFLDKLYELSLAPIRIKRRVNLDFRRTSNLEYLYLYLKDPNALMKLAGEYLIGEHPSPQEFFKALESTYISALISEVRIRVNIKNTDGSLTFRELSEGEQQLLMVLGLLRFTREEESLFLLDEPDTHLNPAWSQRYLEFLREVVGDQETSHIIMATHDPLVISGLERSQVVILSRDSESGSIHANNPENDPAKMGYSEILTSDIFRLYSILSPKLRDLLDEKREIAAKDSLSKEEQDRLAQLNNELKGFDFDKVVVDPLYEPFIEAMIKMEKEEGLREAVLTKAQMELRKKRALEILSKLKAERE